MAAQSVADVMTPEVISVTPGAAVTEAAEMMREYDVGDVLVVEGGRVQGIVTDATWLFACWRPTSNPRRPSSVTSAAKT